MAEALLADELLPDNDASPATLRSHTSMDSSASGCSGDASRLRRPRRSTDETPRLSEGVPHMTYTSSFRSVDLSETGTCRQEVWRFLNAQPAARGCRRYARAYESFSISLVIANVVLDILGSLRSLEHTIEHLPICLMFQRGTCVVFLFEYIGRIWSCMEDLHYAERGFVCGRLRWASQFLSIVDFVVILAFFLDLALSGQHTKAIRGLQALRMVRLLRVLALLKMERKTNSFNLLFQVLSNKKSELVATLFIAGVLMLISATLIFYLESSSQPQFSSIPAAMWWSVTALTTVGYGDIVPVTAPGKVLASFVAVFGIGLFALPAGILGSGFVEVLQESQEADADAALIHDEQETAEESKKVETLAIEVKSLKDTVSQIQEDQQQILELLQQLVNCRQPGGAIAAGAAASLGSIPGAASSALRAG